MSTLLFTQNLSYTFNDSENLFEDLSLSIANNDKIGLIGNNGAGKSTLLRILAKSVVPTTGSIHINSTISYLEQLNKDHFEGDSLSILDYIISRNEDWWEPTDFLMRVFGTELDVEKPVNSLSGGEIQKLNLAITLTESAELTLLDEPTNHLDFNSIQQLIKFLKTSKSAYLIVSHDIWFLDEVIDTIWALKNKGVKIYGGNYSFYKEQIAIEREAMNDSLKAKLKEIKKVKESIRRENEMHQKKSAKMNKLLKGGNSGMPKMLLRNLKSKGEVAHSKQKILLRDISEKRSEDVEKYKEIKSRKVVISLNSEVKRNCIIKIQNEDLSVESKLLIKDINLEIYYGDRIRLFGDNGSGKTSLSNRIIKRLKDTAFSYQYLTQKYELIELEKSLLENIFKMNSDIGFEDARKLLGNFLFYNEYDVNRKASTLSGGEKTRLALAMITAKPLDLLILDEPTNNLDIETIEIIEQTLNDFTGALLVISHNQNFINNLNISNVLSIEHSQIISAKVE